MAHLLFVVVLIAVVDSINPSTVAPALYLASGTRALRALAGFIAGVVSASFIAGFVVLIGPGQGLLAVVPRPGAHVRHLLELCLGVALLALAAGLWRGRREVAKHVTVDHRSGERSSFVLGLGIMAVELPTAFPYFATIAAILGSGRSISAQVVVLAIYNAVFVAPLVGILGLRSVAGRRGQGWLERLRDFLDRRFPVLIPALVLLAAVSLIAFGSISLLD